MNWMRIKLWHYLRIGKKRNHLKAKADRWFTGLIDYSLSGFQQEPGKPDSLSELLSFFVV